MSLFVAQGSIYNPGWSVIEQVEPALQRVHATFDEKVDAEKFLASCRRCGCDSPRVKILDGICASAAACMKRMRARVGVRLVLENPPTVTVNEPDRIAREIRSAYYRHGLCVDCGMVRYSPGRTRCDACFRGAAQR